MKNKIALFCLLLPAAASAQPIGGGFKFGLPLGDAIDVATAGSVNASTILNRKNTYGLYAEGRLPFGLGVELDILHTGTGLVQGSVSGATVSGLAASLSGWEFPVLAKYKFKGKPFVRPFVDAGPSFRRLTQLNQVAGFVTGKTASGVSQASDANSTGFAIGGGLEFKFLILHITPEVRFTRWGVKDLLSGAGGVIKTHGNQGAFLVGIGF